MKSFCLLYISVFDSDLSLGELLHDDMFGLFEAMSAIEMMDPKMDAGMMCNRGFKHIMDFDEQVEVGNWTCYE